jgi:hypothetical protein
MSLALVVAEIEIAAVFQRIDPLTQVIVVPGVVGVQKGNVRSRVVRVFQAGVSRCGHALVGLSNDNELKRGRKHDALRLGLGRNRRPVINHDNVHGYAG